MEDSTICRKYCSRCSLKKAINEQLSRTVDTDITILDLENCNVSHNIYGPYDMGSTEPRVKSLEGLQYAVNLTSLYINFGDSSDSNAIAPIANLTKLEYLDLSFSYLTTDSLHHLVNSTNLNSLNLYYNKIEALAPLEPLIEVKLQQFRNDPTSSEFYFYTSRNQIMDFRGTKTIF